MKTILIAAASALALSASPGHSVGAKPDAPLLQTAEAAEGGASNNHYGTPQPQPEFAAFVQPSAAAPAPVSL